MSKKIKFNIHDIFMEGQNTVADRNFFVSSPLFPVFVSVYNRALGKVRVGLLKTRQAANGKTYISEVPIVTPLGLRVASLENTSIGYDALSFDICGDPLSSTTSNALRTSNPKYIQSRMSANSEYDCAISFDNQLSNRVDTFNRVIRNMIDLSIDNKFGKGLDTAPNFISRQHAEPSLITFLARYFVDEVTKSDMDAKDRAQFDVMFMKYIEEREKFKNALADTLEMVSTEKWVYIKDVNGGVILGAIRPEPMCAALDKYMSKGVLPPSDYSSNQFSYVQESVPFKWYPSFDHIPEEHRVGLTFSMVMLKAHTGSADMLPTEGIHIHYELGAYCECRYGRSSVYVLTK